MADGLRNRLELALRRAAKDRFGVEIANVVEERPPRPSLGDVAFPVAFELARIVKKPPREIAEGLAPVLSEVEEVTRVNVAGAGYLNVYFDRHRYLADFLAEKEPEPGKEKVIVEHTNINPNKAAHIGHLRNATLGDTFVRVLRFRGQTVEVQNYIDDTGVQVADVVVGLVHLEGKTLDEVRKLIETERFDYYCWDLYARVSEYYSEDRARVGHREHTLKAIEEGESPASPMAALVAEAIVRCHLATMERIDVVYDLLPWESDILKLRFWEHAYELLKEQGAIRKATSGKNRGCWVMDMGEIGGTEEGGSDQDEKVIVRSNGTVTYVGKDIAYQLWKLGLLDRRFGYRRFHRSRDGHTVWSTTPDPAEGKDAPEFGHGGRVYNVIDARQAYLQRVVQRGVELIASTEDRERSRHFSYEMVALTPATCRELGFPVSPEEESKPFLEVSGRKGLGVKADDLLDTLEEDALREVEKRNPDLDPEELESMAGAIARGALRYFMIKFTKNKIIAFDFAEALSFEGESGPYLQYACVRAAKILQKLGAVSKSAEGGEIDLPDVLADGLERLPQEEAEDLWGLVFGATELSSIAEAVVRTEEPAHLARYSFQQAQRFNAFYHRYPILKEPDETRRALRLFAVSLFYRQQAKALELMGIPVPTRM